MTDQRVRGDSEGSLAVTGTVLVTGPAIPLTRALAREAGVRGAVVALASPCGTGAMDPVEVESFPTGLSSEDEVDTLFDAVLSRFSRLNVVFSVWAPEALPELHEVTLDRWRQAVSEPLRRHFWVTRRVLEEWLAEGTRGRLVTVLAPDAPSGALNEIVAEGFRSFTRSMAREYGSRGITSNLVLLAPGGARGPAPFADATQAILEQALFLASPAASFVTGEALTVDILYQPGEHTKVD